MHGNSDEEARTTETQGISQIDPELKENSDNTEKRDIPKSENLFKNWPLMSSIIVYCVFSLLDIGFTEVKFYSSNLSFGTI